MVWSARLPGLSGVVRWAALRPWHPAAVLALPAEDGRLWRGGKRGGWNRGHDLAIGAARYGESVRAVARALRCGLATVQRALLAGTIRGAPRPVSGSCP